MSLLSVLYRYGVWISIPLFCVGVVLLVLFISSLVRLGDRKRICSVQLVAEQDVEFPEAGPVVLFGEGPFMTSRFADLSFQLIPGDGSVLTGSAPWMRTKSSGMSQVRLELRRFDLPYGGRYLLRIEGLQTPAPGDKDHRIVFARPSGREMTSYIVGIVVSSVLVVGSVVLFVLRLTIGPE